MKVQVKPLRQRGARRGDHEIQAMEPVTGSLTLYGVGTTLQVSIRDPSSQLTTGLLPDLYDARLVTMNAHKMLFAGIERTGDPSAAQYLQEWAVAIVSL